MKMKRILSIVLCLALAISLLPGIAAADEASLEVPVDELGLDMDVSIDESNLDVGLTLDDNVDTVTFYAYPAGGGTVDASLDQNNVVTATANPQDGYHFLYWWDMDNDCRLCEDNTYSFPLDRNMRVCLVFGLGVAVLSVENGWLEILDPKPAYAAGDTVTLLGHPNEGYAVDYYLAGEVHNGYATPQLISGNSFVMPAWDMAVAVYFVPGYTVSAAVSPADGGAVTGAGTYRPGDTVTLTAEPAEGYAFTDWTENGVTVSTERLYSFTAEADRALTANFQSYEGMTFTVNASSVPAAGGTVTGTGTYNGGETVTLTALPNPGYSFLGWSEYGATLGTDPVYSFTANGNRTLTASFQSEAGVSYVDAAGNELLCESFTTVTSATTAMTTGWYAVAGSVTIPSRMEVSGNVNLILCDGANLTVPKGIHLTGSNALTVWGQSGGDGALVIDNVERKSAGIGGNLEEPGGVFTVNGGTVTANGGYAGAGIGGGGDSATAGSADLTPENCAMHTRGWAGTVTINGGTVTANGGNYGAGIGCGIRGNGGTVTITGGTVTANGGYAGAGIGGSNCVIPYRQTIETVHITGGTVYATGGGSAAGIGGGMWGAIGNVVIDGGTVVATGGDGGAGIGCGYFGADGLITIHSGNVTATGGNGGAGIGGGDCAYGTVVIHGGTVRATGGENGAGIGGGYNLGTDAYTVGGTVTITGGDVTATGGTGKTTSGAGIGGGAHGPGGTTTISGGTVRASGGFHMRCNGAGIGGGSYAAGGTVIISAGTVRANGGTGAAGIGSGSNYGGNGDAGTMRLCTVTITGGNVTASGGKYGAGIGGGDGVSGGTVTISGGDHTVTGGRCAAGVGGGQNGAGGSARFTGGSTRVSPGACEDMDCPSQAVGHGDSSDNSGTLTLDDAANDLHIRVGRVENGTSWANLSSRDAYARDCGVTVIIESCQPHSYDASGYCPLCGVSGGPVLQNHTFVNEEGADQGSRSCVPMTASVAAWHTTGAHGGWYAVTENVTIPDRVTVSGNVNLILCDGAALTVPKGIEVAQGNSLTVWRQENATGQLFAGGSCHDGDAAIGGGSGKNAGTVTVCGARVTALAGAGAQAIGHGADADGAGALNLRSTQVFDSDASAEPVANAQRESVCRGSRVVLGPCLTHDYAYGICWLCDRHQGVNYLEDGSLRTCDTYYAYTGQSALTEGWYVLPEDVETTERVTVSGSVDLILSDGHTWNAEAGVTLTEGAALTLWAQSDGDTMGALIAAGTDGLAGIGIANAALTVRGGAVTARGGENGAGVGGSDGEGGGAVTMRGGVLTATGGTNAAGIGGGVNGAGGMLIMNGGVLTATGGANGAGIGGGLNGDGGTLTMNGGTLTATGGESGGSSVGGGAGGAGGTVTVNGGVLTATGGAEAQAIGRGSGDADPGALNIDGIMAGYPDESGQVAEWVSPAARTDACRNTLGAAVRLERCFAHTDEDHDEHCDVCGLKLGAYYLDPTTGESVLCSSYSVFNGSSSLQSSGWYVVDASRQIGSRISISGGKDVNLILCDGVELTAARGITVPMDSSLTVWAQSADPETAGRLTIPETLNNYAGIGGRETGTGQNVEHCGSVTINGGTVTVTASGYGAAIGGGGNYSDGKIGGNGGAVTIRGGAVNLTYRHGSGIGGGSGGKTGGAGGSVTISGGTVNIVCTDVFAGAGIGGGMGDSDQGGAGGTVTVTGGTVNITRTKYVTGIGGGYGQKTGGAGAAVTVSGGTVTIGGGERGAAIGGGYGQSDGVGADGTLNLSGVRAGTVDGAGSAAWVASGNRETVCRSKTEAIRLEACEDHVFFTGTDNGDGTHIPICGYCGQNGPAEAHDYTGGICICGAIGGPIPYKDPTDPSQPDKSHECQKLTGGSAELTEGWYVVIPGALRFADRITVTGDVNLILMDHAELTAEKGFTVNEGDSLTIWARSTDPAVAGKLTVTGVPSSSAGIGSGGNKAAGSITINGGVITSVGKGSGAAIGGYGSKGSGSVTINGGTVNATADTNSAAIGGGLGTVTINGGVLNAAANSYGAGIGGGIRQNGGTILITGGVVNVTGTKYGAGIGGGGRSTDTESAGSGGDITITGGTVTVTAGQYAPAIGGGTGPYGATGGSGGNITISGGSITIFAGVHGAAIGGGNSGTNSEDSTVFGVGGDEGNITVTGGSITVSTSGARAFGPGCNYASGDNYGSAGSLSIADGLLVCVGESEAAAANAPVSQRENACHGAQWASIAPCPHDGAAYTDNGDGTHTVACPYCAPEARTEPHSFTDHLCVCGVEGYISITQQPADAGAALNEIARTTVVAEGEGLTYQWYGQDPGGKEFKSGLKGDTYSLTMVAAKSGRQVWCVITDAEGHTVTTGKATLTLIPPEGYAPPRITVQPESAKAQPGETATVTLTAEGDTELRYQWYFSNDGGASWSRSSIKSDTYAVTMNASRSGRQLYCVVTDGYGNTATSNTVTLAYDIPDGYTGPTIDPLPDEAKADPGEVASVTVTARGTGDVGEGLTYQWYLSNDYGSTWSRSSIKTDTYAVEMNASRVNRQLYCVVTDQYGNKATSETVILSYAIPEGYYGPNILTYPPYETLVQPGEAAVVTVEAEGPNGDAEGLAYTWYFQNYAEAVWYRSSITSNTYSTTMNTTRNGRVLRCVVTDKYGYEAETPPVVIGFDYPEGYETPKITAQPTDVFVGAGELASTSFVAEGAELTYQWYLSSDGVNWSRSSLTGDTYSVTMIAAKSGRQVKCKVTDKYGAFVWTEIATLTMQQPEGYELRIVSQPEDCTVARGEKATSTFTVEGAGLKYQWYGIDPGQDDPWTSSIRTDTYSVTMIPSKSGRQIYCVVTDAYGNSVTSDIATLTMSEPQPEPKPEPEP